MRYLARITVMLALFVSVAPGSRAQDLGETLQSVGQAYAEAYTQPLVNAFGADMNSGLFHTAKIGGGLIPMVDIYVGVKAFGAFVPDDEQTLDLTYTAPQAFEGPDGNTYMLDVTYQINDAPTIFGEDTRGIVTASVNETVHPGPDGVSGTADDVVIDEQSELELAPGLVNTSIVPLLIPQVHIGSLFGTDIMIRYLPTLENPDVGSLGFFGFGIRHSISQYIPLMPVSIAAQLAWQNLSVKDVEDAELLDASMFAMSLIASKSFLIAGVYGGLQVESTNFDVDYTYVPDDPEIPAQRVSFSLDGRNRFRAVAGVSLNMGPVLVNFDYSLGSVNVVSAGVGLSL